MVDYDNLLTHLVGEFGPYQKRCVVLLCFVAVLTSLKNTAPVFIQAPTDYWCKMAESSNLTDECETLNKTDDCHGRVQDLLLPRERDDGSCESGWKWSSCFRYEVMNATDFLSLAQISKNTSNVVKCDNGWTYDTSQYTSTMIHEFDLVCDTSYQSALITSLYMSGNAVGCFAFGPVSDMIIPESPRWLISVGKISRAMKIIQKTALVNKVSIPDNVLTSTSGDEISEKSKNNELGVKNENVRKTSPIDLFRFRNMRMKTCILMFCNFSASLTYFGFTLNISNIGGNDYINVTIAGAVEILAVILASLLIETRLGRRFTFFGGCLVSGVMSFVLIFIPQCGDLFPVMITFNMIGKFSISGVFAISWIYFTELYPTVVRSSGASISVMAGMIGAIMAPQILDFRQLWEHLPKLVFSLLPILSAFLVLCLPETRGEKLPETMEEGEWFGR
ncbi:organic cation transporter protein-like [Glandiceps talaboti]